MISDEFLMVLFGIRKIGKDVSAD